MDRFVDFLLGAPIANQLIVAGIAFLGLAVLVAYRDAFRLDRVGRVSAFAIGLTLLTIGLALTLNVIGRPPSPTPGPGVAVSGTLSASPTLTATPLASTLPAASEDCFTRAFEGIPSNRMKTMEVGSHDLDLTEPEQSKDGPLAIRFTENRQVIGAVRLDFLSTSALFRVQGVMDARCNPVETYANASRGGDKRVLHEWDELRIEFSGRAYLLRIGDYGYALRASLVRVS